MLRVHVSVTVLPRIPIGAAAAVRKPHARAVAEGTVLPVALGVSAAAAATASAVYVDVVEQFQHARRRLRAVVHAGGNVSEDVRRGQRHSFASWFRGWHAEALMPIFFQTFTPIFTPARQGVHVTIHSLSVLFSISFTGTPLVPL